MSKPFKIDLVGDASKFLRAGRDVEDNLSKVADSLDAVAKDGAAGSDKLDKTFTDAFKSVRSESSKTGKSIGDDVKHGTAKAGEAVGTFKEEAHSSAREAAASFSGSFDDISQMAQEVAANALGGLGPAGAAAGIAAAAGIGLLTQGLQAAADQAAATKQTTIDLASELIDVNGNPAAIDWANKLKTSLFEIVDTKEWYEFWQDQPKTRLEEWSKAAKVAGLNISDMAKASTGDMSALERVTGQLDTKIQQLESTYDGSTTGGAAWQAAQPDIERLRKIRDELSGQAGEVSNATELYNEYKAAVAATAPVVVAATQESSAATQAYTDAVQSALADAGQSWDTYVESGKVNLKKYNDAMEAEQTAVTKFQSNLVTASQTLSGEALSYIESLGPQAAPLLQAYIDSPLAQQQRTAAIWQTLGRTARDSFTTGLNLTSAVDNAITAAQGQARAVVIQTRLETKDLATEAARAAAAIPPVTIKAKFGYSTPAIG